ncbi:MULTISPECIES: hypothetical protein [unclassified Nocardioides]|uniref:hypothetical protein n=1 Tax=unclassified Nocardioides TaxID=2615069 RepID=UPI00361D740A
MHALRAAKPPRSRLIAGVAAVALGAGGIVGLAAPAQAATAAPANLSAAPNEWSIDAVDITWEQGKYYWELEEAGEELVEYEYRVLDAGDEVVYADITVSQNAWVDQLEPGATYTVEVASIVDDEYSDWASEQVTTYERFVGAPSDVAIQGSLTVGSTLSVATTGAWEDGADVTYEWFGTLPEAQSSGPVIATGPTLPLTQAHLDMAIYVVVTGTKDGLATVGLASAPNLTTRVTNPAPPVTAPTTPAAPAPAAPKVLTAATPKITGKAEVGETLTAKAGDWTDGAKLTYRWEADGKAIKGADDRTLELTKALKGKRISVTVTGTLTGYATVSKASAETAKVSAADKPGKDDKGKGKGDKPGKGKPGKGKGGKPGKGGKGKPGKGR